MFSQCTNVFNSKGDVMSKLLTDPHDSSRESNARSTAKMMGLVLILTIIISLLQPVTGQDRSKQVAEAGTKKVLAGQELNIADFTYKNIIERPLKSKLGDQKQKSFADHSKVILEAPLKSALVDLGQFDELKAAANLKISETKSPKAQAAAKDKNNPTVKPGDVKWHKDFQAACVASASSGKPVLHFQLLGKLDQRFT